MCRCVCCTLFSRLDSSFLLCDILNPVGFHIEEIHGLCCAFFYSATLCFSNEILKLLHTPMKIMLLTSDYVRIILSGVGLCFYTLAKEPLLRLSFMKKSWKDCSFCEVVRMSTAASVQQSVMNFGILMIQGLVNSFGTTVMAAFTVAIHNC